MFLVMGVTLYTSRIVLDQLGVSDYGLYSLVGGVVSMFAFFNSAMSSATQRYLAYDLGKNDEKRLQHTFGATLTIHIGIAVLILILAETIGLWYVNNKIVLPPDRLFAANVVYQFSVAASLVGVIQIPYDALIIAYERMNIYAYVSILEVSLKLGAVFLLVFYKGDKLILYAVLVFLISVTIRIIYQIYCRRHFSASKYVFRYDKEYYRELISYSGWNLFGGVAAIARGQGLNLILNLFYSTVANAAYGLALQIQSAVNLFVTNFQKAVNPQIIKNYSRNEIKKMGTLIIKSSKYSFFLMLLISAPIISNVDFILGLWLKEPPIYTRTFVQLSLIGVLIDCISGPLMIGVQASGKIKWYQIVIGSLIIFSLPVSYIWLRLGGSPFTVFYTIIIINLSSFFARMFFVKKLLGIKPLRIITEVFLRILIVSAANYFLVSYIKTHFIVNDWILLILSFFITLLCVIVLGIGKSDYRIIKSIIKIKK